MHKRNKLVRKLGFPQKARRKIKTLYLIFFFHFSDTFSFQNEKQMASPRI